VSAHRIALSKWEILWLFLFLNVLKGVTECIANLTRDEHTQLRWRIELPLLHMVYDSQTFSIRHRAEITVAKQEIG